MTDDGTKVKNWRDDPEIQECKNIARIHSYDIVIVIGIDADRQIHASSYGVTGALCSEGGRFMRAATDGIRQEAAK